MRKAPLPTEDDIKDINDSLLSYEAAKAINDLIIFGRKNNEVFETICNSN